MWKKNPEFTQKIYKTATNWKIYLFLYNFLLNNADLLNILCGYGI